MMNIYEESTINFWNVKLKDVRVSFFPFFLRSPVCSLPYTNKGTSRREEECIWYP